MSTSIKQEKEAFLLRQLKSGERSGEFLEKELNKQFPGAVAARFRSEVEGLIKRGEITREGTGATAVFRLAKGAKVAPAKKALANKAVTASRPAPIPEVNRTQSVQEFTDAQMASAQNVLEYVARNGARDLNAIIKKACVDFTLVDAQAMVLMHNRKLIDVSNNMVTVTREGYACLDAVRAGENYR